MGTPVKNPERPGEPRPKLEFPPISSRTPDVREKAESAIRSFSIVLGGPLYEFLLRHGVVRFALPNVFRRIAALVALTWLPLLLLSLKDGLAFGGRVQVPLLYDFAIYGRFLLALPLLVLAEVVIDPAIRQAVAEFVEAHFVKDEELPKFEGVLVKMQQLRDSWIPEAIILVLAFFPVFLYQRGFTVAASSWHTTNGHLSAAGWWFAAFSTPVVRFICYRWLFRYFVWTALLRRISGLNLALMPTHPDHAAGLNFLALAQKRFGILFCSFGCMFAGGVANRMAFEGASVNSLRFLIAGFIVLSLILGLVPLLMLAPKLSKVRRKGLVEYGRLANSYTESFDRKWVRGVEGSSEELLGTGDIQSLADMGNSFALVDAMTIAPITKRLVLQLTAQAALPLIPVIVLGTPTPELVHAIIKMLA